MDFGHLLRSARRAAGLTQAELAMRSGISQPNLSSYEAGRKQPSTSTLTRLLGPLGLGLSVAPVEVDRAGAASLQRHEHAIELLVAEPEATLDRARARLEDMRSDERYRAATGWLDKWEALLYGPSQRLVAALADPSTDGVDLRQVSPFMPWAASVDAAPAA